MTKAATVLEEPIAEEIKLAIVPPERAAGDWWETIARFLQKGDQYAVGRYSAWEMKDRVKDGTVMILVAWNPETSTIHAAFAAEGAEYPRKKVFAIILAGGEDIWKWKHLWPAFEFVARDLGFDQIEIVGRRGWGRFIDAPEVASVFVKELV